MNNANTADTNIVIAGNNNTITVNNTVTNVLAEKKDVSVTSKPPRTNNTRNIGPLTTKPFKEALEGLFPKRKQ